MSFSIARFAKGIVKFFLFIISLVAVGALSAYITMNLIIGGNEIEVPNIGGKDVKEAIEILAQKDLHLVISESKRYDETTPVDHILIQTPNAGSMIKKGRNVEVILSMGTEKIDLPSFLQKTERESIIMVQQLELRVGTVNIIANRIIPEGVIAQYPEPAIKVARGSAIDLLINRRSEAYFIMPDLIGKNLDTLTDFFHQNKMKIGGIKVEDYPGLPPGTVIKQQPSLGYPIKRSDIISITVNK